MNNKYLGEKMKILAILIVDDENFVCENLKLKLKRLTLDMSFSIDSCNSAKQAQILLKENSYDLIFTDIRMPFADGLSLIKSVRENGFLGKIFVLSGYDDFDYVRTAFVNGADDYILKPIAISQLRDKLSFQFSSMEENAPLQEKNLCSDIISYAKKYILEHYSDNTLSMSEVATHISVSYSHFSNLFCQETGKTFPAYLLQIRIQKAIELLEDPSLKIADISYKVGFKYPQQFSKGFKKVTGVYPTEYNFNKHS